MRQVNKQKGNEKKEGEGWEEKEGRKEGRDKRGGKEGRSAIEHARLISSSDVSVVAVATRVVLVLDLEEGLEAGAGARDVGLGAEKVDEQRAHAVETVLLVDVHSCRGVVRDAVVVARVEADGEAAWLR